LIFPADRVHLVEPLVTSGRTGAGDFIFVRYEDEGHVSIGVDHWGVGAQISTPAAVDYRRPHELVIVAGNLMPPDGSAAYRGRSDGARLRGSLRVILDGVTVLSAPQEFHATRPEEIVFGINLIGGSTVLPGFSGEALSLESASPEAIGAALPPSSSAGRAGWRP